jgi:HTH-type transcriptional regulator, competence development regulator
MAQRLTNIGDRFRAAAEIEANTPITVGTTTVSPEERLSERGGTEWLALAKLVELRRRQCRLSVEDLATRADVDLEDIVNIERGEGSVPEPRTVHQIAGVLKLPERRLLQLAGLVVARDNRLREATVRFAARSESIEELRPEELEALEEYVKVLAES